MTRAQNVKVSRVRLIERLKEAQKTASGNRTSGFLAALAEEQKDAKDALAQAERRIAKLAKVKRPEDVAKEYWARPYLGSDDLDKQIRLLELSDEDTITVGPSSNLWGWL